MTIPGFNAEATASISRSRGMVVASALPGDSETPRDRTADCMEACLNSGQSSSACSRRCRPRSVPYQCTERDNTVNRTLCLGGMTAWDLAYKAECGLLSGLPGAGPALSALCVAGCTELSSRMSAGCPEATICV